jgi:membrane-associated phospholipid phosphatase
MPPHPRPPWAALGVHRLCFVLWGVNAATGATLLLVLRATGIEMAWSSGLPIVYVILALAAAWGYYARFPGPPGDWIIPEAVMVVGLFLANTLVAPPIQYPAAALQRPLIDPWLAAADARLGISVPAIVQWTAQFPLLVRILWWAYFSLLPQFLLPLVLLPWLRDRAALWEYAWHFLFCAAVTVLCFGLFPAACTFSYQHFDSLINQSRFIEQFTLARAGGLTTIDYDHIEGLVSCPSFHVAGAWMVTWAFRRTALVWPLTILNLTLAASTVMLGAHYLVDLVATAIMIGVSVFLYRFVRVAPYDA